MGELSLRYSGEPPPHPRRVQQRCANARMIREESALPVPKRKGCLDVFLPNKNTLPLADTHTNMYMLAQKAAKRSVISEIHTRIHKCQEGELKRCYWQLAGHFKILIYHLNPPGAKTVVMEMFYCVRGSRMQYCKTIKLHEIYPPPTSSFYTPPPFKFCLSPSAQRFL